jgi:hypothetical protein
MVVLCGKEAIQIDLSVSGQENVSTVPPPSSLVTGPEPSLLATSFSSADPLLSWARVIVAASWRTLPASVA